MIFSNLFSIVSDHYSSLRDESGVATPYDIIFLVIVFLALPLALGFSLSHLVPIWSGFIAACAPIMSVLTGFSINTIILLMRYDPDGKHFYEQRTVEKTREFTLYSILTGIVIIIALVIGFILTQIEGGIESHLSFIVSGVIYSLIIHYFLTLLTVTHRLWGLINGEVLEG